MSRKCDIAIVGGGLAGASLAIALAPLAYDIKVVEAVAFKASEQPSYDDRTLAMSHSSCRILSTIGLWDHLQDDATAIRKIYVSALDRPGRVVLDAAEMDLSEFGHVIEARRFGAVVTAQLEQAENIEVLSPARVTGILCAEDATTLQLKSDSGNEELQAKLVVAADGANSFIRKHLQIPTETRDYDQTAVICNITPEQPHAGRAYECLTATGPFAVLPHTGMRCGLVWSVASDDVQALLELDDATFLSLAQERFGDHLGAFLKAGKRTAYPLKLVRAKEDVRERLVILGNAAHAIHPVGAQGFNLALRDVAVLAEILADDENKDPGQQALLKQYSRWRKQDQRGTIATSDGITRLFAHPSMLAAGLRTSGLIAHSLLPSLRRKSAIQAMGYRGRVPRLALGEPLSPA
ncbi:MAG: 2-octaprenyl-6-methoxyphenyl hydroxylase [Xanthomonadales bacterium]|nr:2-octaprenyl-6-methoxyphenyl hydroxylase [Xanthomonadales bacterium]